MRCLSEDFEFFIEQYGAPLQAVPLSPMRSLELRNQLPHSLVDFWEEYGIGSVLDGMYRFCDPSDYRSVLTLLFKSDKDFNHNDCHVFGYSAFGKLSVWSERYGVCNINLLNLTMDADEFFDEGRDDDISIGVAATGIDSEYYDLEDCSPSAPMGPDSLIA